MFGSDYVNMYFAYIKMLNKLVGVLLLCAVAQSFYFGVNRKQMCLVFKPTN